MPIFLCLLFVFPQGPSKEELRQAQKLVLTNSEPSVKKGTELCANLNCVSSMEILLRRFKGAQPHYRDIVWKGIVRFTDPYSREMIASELKKNKKSASMRQWAAEALGIYADATYGPVLMKAARDKDVGVRRAVAKSLGNLGLKESEKVLVKFLQDKDFIVRGNAVESLLKLGFSSGKEALVKGLQDPDGGTRAALLSVAPKYAEKETASLAIVGLRDEDWRVRLQAIRNLLGCEPSVETMDALIPAIARVRPLVRIPLLSGIRDWTGMKFHKAEDWERWWSANRDTFLLEKGKGTEGGSQETVATYNGLRVDSDHVAFLMDISSSMDDRTSKGERKRELALQELKKTLESLPETTKFNVYAYSSNITVWEKEAQPVNPKNIKSVLKFVQKTKARGNKNIWGALLAVLGDPTIDTVFLLSSGEPEVGLYVHHNRVVDHLVDWNRFRKMVVHGVAYSKSKWNQDQIRHISEGTGGSFMIVD